MQFCFSVCTLFYHRDVWLFSQSWLSPPPAFCSSVAQLVPIFIMCHTVKVPSGEAKNDFYWKTTKKAHLLSETDGRMVGGWEGWGWLTPLCIAVAERTAKSKQGCILTSSSVPPLREFLKCLSTKPNSKGRQGDTVKGQTTFMLFIVIKIMKLIIIIMIIFLELYL